MELLIYLYTQMHGCRVACKAYTTRNKYYRYFRYLYGTVRDVHVKQEHSLGLAGTWDAYRAPVGAAVPWAVSLAHSMGTCTCTYIPSPPMHMHMHLQHARTSNPKKEKKTKPSTCPPSPCTEYVVLWQELSDDGGANEPRARARRGLEAQARLLTARLNRRRGLSVCLPRTNTVCPDAYGTARR